MESKKDIGKAFRDKLDGLQQSPPDAVWERLQAEMQGKKKRRVIPFWFTAAAIVLVLLLAGGLLGIPYNEGNDKGTGNSPATSPVPANSTVTTGNPESAAGLPTTGTDTNTPDGAQNNNIKTNSINDNNNTLVNNNTSAETNTGATPKSDSSYNKANDNAGTTSTGTSNKLTKQPVTNAAYTSATVNSNNKATNQDRANNSNSNKKLKTPGSTNNSGYAVNEADTRGTINRSVTVNEEPGNTGIEDTNTAYDSEPANNKIKQNKQDKNRDTGIAYSTDNDTEGNNDTTDTNVSADNETTSAEARLKDSLKIEARNARIAQLREQSEAEDEEEYNDDEDYTAPPLEPEKFYVFVHGGPAFYNLPGDTSNIDASLNNNSTDSKTSFNYGAYVGFILNDRFSLRVGFINTKLERVTNNVTLQSYNAQNPAYPNGIMPPADYTGVEYRENTSNDAVLKTLGDDYTANIKLTQRAEFYEFPVEAVYNLYGNRAGINAVGGVSAFYLRNNTLTASNQNGSFAMGSIKGISDLSLSANLGLNFYYEVTPGLKINAEPLFKYHLSDFAGATLYNLNLQFGLQYTFNKNR